MATKKRMLVYCVVAMLLSALPLRLYHELAETMLIVRSSFDRFSVAIILHQMQTETTTSANCDPIQHSLNRHFEWAVPHFHALFRRPLERFQNNGTANQSPADMDSRCWSPLQQQLLQSTVPYYVYPPNMLFGNSRFYLENLENNSFDNNPNLLPEHHRVDSRYEIDILEALLNHSSRVYEQAQAELFVIAAPFSTIYYDGGSTKKCKDKRFLLRRLASNVESQPAWLQRKPHVVVAMTSHLFTCLSHTFADQLGLPKLYAKFQNVAVARSDDFFAARYAFEHNLTSPRGFDNHVGVIRPVTKYSFSVGLGAHAKHIPWTKPSWEKFQNASNFMFYHTRTTPMSCDSTKYRLAPIQNVTWSQLPPSSVGFDLPAAQWLHDFIDSKFCLVMRGDTPHSHSLFAAVKAGCIPVVVSDWYLFYAPPFPSTLNMWDFSIFLSEHEFIQNPQASLASLQDLPQKFIQAKLDALEFAQRVMILDHPQSLFVPAFVREALGSFTRPRAEIVPMINTTWCPNTCV